MTKPRGGLRGRIAVVATVLMLGACSTSGTLEEIAAGAEGVASPSPSASPAAGEQSPTASPVASAGAAPSQSAPASAAPASAAPASAAPASPASAAPPATSTDDLAGLCAIGTRLLTTGVVSYASDAFERALEHDEDLACAREGYEAALIARRESAVLAARAAAEPKRGRQLRLYTAAVARDYTNDDAYESLVAVAGAYAGRGRCKRAAEALDGRLHGVAVALATGGESQRCTKAAASAGSAEDAARHLLEDAREEEQGRLAARDLYLTALEMDPTLATGRRAEENELTETLEGILPNPNGWATSDRLRDRVAERSEDLYEGLDSLAKGGILLAFLAVVLLTALTYVPGLTTTLRWLSRRRWDVSRPDDGDGLRATRVVARVLLAPLRAVYRTKFEVPAPKKDGGG